MAYVTLAEARSQGVPSSIEDGNLAKVLADKSDFMDIATRQWFEPRYKQMFMDGNDSRTLFFSVPIISVDALYVNGDFTNALDTNLYKVYNSRDIPDDRRNPMIKLASPGLGLFDVPDLRCGALFVIGTQNQRIDGMFGFTEPDGTTPSAIKRAVLKLAIKQLQLGPTGKMWDEIAGGPPTQGNVTSETTDGHSISYNAFQYKPLKPGLNGITNDPEVDGIIMLYRAPIKITSTTGRGGPDRRW